MSIRHHHWASDRHERKTRLLDFIKKNPGIEKRILMKAMSKLLKISHRAIELYLSELQYEDEIENRDGKFYPFGYEEQPQEQDEKKADS